MKILRNFKLRIRGLLRLIFFLFISQILFFRAGYSETSSKNSIVVGSKKFTENIILGEIIILFCRNQGIQVQHRKVLGGTRILWKSLLIGDVDIYPEYTGTMMREILAKKNIRNPEFLPRALKEFGIKMTRPLGFNNTYILGMRKNEAIKYNIKKISDLSGHPNLIFGFSNEFLDRKDGWFGLKKLYNLPHGNVTGLDHDLAYRGLESGDLNITDLYATDAEIEYYNLYPLIDDLNYFPSYHAVFIYNEKIEIKFPALIKFLKKLEGKIDDALMAKMNARVKLNRRSEAEVASDFLRNNFGLEVEVNNKSIWTRLWKNTYDHLILVAISLFSAIIVAIPLGIIAFRNQKLGQIILGITGIIQTIPSLAIFVFMIPLLGIGEPSAILALFLYSLLPIVRNTYSGLHDIPTPITESAKALGLSNSAILRLVELPLATRSILSGIKTSSIINVGAATLGALIGSGGYGQPILTGIRMDDMGLILQGAIPAAVLALLVQGIFETAERLMLSKGLKHSQK